MELKLSLRFACCSCDLTITVTLKCQGDALAETDKEVLAAVNVPCPDCGQVHQLVFEPRGAIRAVRPATLAQPMPEPSIN